MARDDSPPTPRASYSSQQLLALGVVALLFMAILGNVASGIALIAGTLLLAVVCLTCFVLALRASQRGAS